MKTNIETVSKDGSSITNHIENVPSQFNLFRMPFIRPMVSWLAVFT